MRHVTSRGWGLAWGSKGSVVRYKMCDELRWRSRGWQQVIRRLLFIGVGFWDVAAVHSSPINSAGPLQASPQHRALPVACCFSLPL